jgi:hypothetical protein
MLNIALVALAEPKVGAKVVIHHVLKTKHWLYTMF